MASLRGEVLNQAKADLIVALRRAARAKSGKALVVAADDVARLTSRIAALEKIGLMGTRLHAI